jgi:hypothetical protein
MTSTVMAVEKMERGKLNDEQQEFASQKQTTTD